MWNLSRIKYPGRIFSFEWDWWCSTNRKKFVCKYGDKMGSWWWTLLSVVKKYSFSSSHLLIELHCNWYVTSQFRTIFHSPHYGSLWYTCDWAPQRDMEDSDGFFSRLLFHAYYSFIHIGIFCQLSMQLKFLMFLLWSLYTHKALKIPTKLCKDLST